MQSGMIASIGLAASMFAAACATSEPRGMGSMLLTDPVRRVDVESLAASMPMEGKNIVTQHVATGEKNSLFLVRIGDREHPHVHTKYDLVVTLVDGVGTLWLAGKELEMAVGDVAHIPRGTSHHFINNGDKPATALVAFTPVFSGPDSSDAPRR